jgi:plasmid stabilization system protein ParE
MPSILITPAAENDLVNIWLYIARDNQDAADRVYQAAEKTFESLLAEPRMAPCIKQNGHNSKVCVSFLSASFKTMSSIIGNTSKA